MNMIDFDHNFFGRKAVLDILKKRVLGLKEGYRQNVALLGGRYIGKTSILHKLIADFEDKDVMFVYLDLEGRDFNYFATQFTKSLLYHFLKSENLAPQEDLKILCASAQSRLPQTVGLVEAVGALIGEGKILEAYHTLLSLPDILQKESGKSVVLILDEFQQLGEFGIDEAFAELGKRIMTQKNVLYVVASSCVQQANTILAEKLSLLFGNFDNIEVGRFNLAESQGLIDHNLNNVKVGLQLKNFVVDFTGGHPLYINLLAQELISLSGVLRQQEIYAPIVTQAIENVVFNPWGVISRHFELQIQALSHGKSGSSLVTVLIALAEGKHKINDLMGCLPLKQIQISQRINILLAAEVIEKNGNYYHIKDKLFRYWVKYVHQRRLKSIDMEPGRSRKQFKEEINKALNDFSMVARKDLTVRMSDLLHKFDNEALTLTGRRYKLSSFRDITPLKLRLGAGNFFDAIQAQGAEENWLIVLKKDPVHENDFNCLLFRR